jgi:hypothetical protein
MYCNQSPSVSHVADKPTLFLFDTVSVTHGSSGSRKVGFIRGIHGTFHMSGIPGDGTPLDNYLPGGGAWFR